MTTARGTPKSRSSPKDIGDISSACGNSAPPAVGKYSNKPRVMLDSVAKRDIPGLRTSTPMRARDMSMSNMQATTRAVMTPFLRKKLANIVRKLISNTDAKEAVAAFVSATQ